MHKIIRDIKSLLNSDFKKYQKTFAEIMSSNVLLVDQVAKYIVKHKGKGIRPLLVLLSARLVGEPNEKTYIVASIIELLHTATLVHDDVVDDAYVRRGFPSINSVWKNKVSVLMGDYLLAKSLIGATKTGELKIMEILAETAKKMSKGELMQIEKSRKLNITEEEYYQLISDKTAALISATCALGAFTASNKTKDYESLKIFGENLGMAFQIKDDLLDYESNQNILGKPAGADLKEKKITLPLLLSFKNSNSREKKLIMGILKKGVNNKDVKTIIAFAEKYGGLRAAKEKAQDFSQKAKNSIMYFPENKYKESALKFVDYVTGRKK